MSWLRSLLALDPELAWRRWQAWRDQTQPLPYFALPLWRRLVSIWLDFLPVAFVIYFELFQRVPDPDTDLKPYLVAYSALTVFWIAPRTFFAVAFRASPAQLLLGGVLRRSSDGSLLSRPRAGLRNALNCLDLIPGVVCINFALILILKDHRTIYDYFAGSVLADRDRPVPDDWGVQVGPTAFEDALS